MNTIRPLSFWGAVAVFFWLWGRLIWQLSLDWSANPQYNYGWFVPFFAAFFLYQRWQNRPEPGAAGRSGVVAGLMILLAAAFLPLRVIQEANPDWHLIAWAMAGKVTGFSLAAIYLAGGRSWLRHFAFPVLFILVAVPWPDWLELGVTQSLMRVVAALTVEALNLAGIPALQQGNLIEIGAGVLGVDEACSGVRSLQATLMVSLFFGEFYRMKWPARIGLIALGCGLAFFFNVVRAFLLGWISARQGLDALSRWHDPAGFSILLASLAVLAIAAKWWFPAGAEPAVYSTGAARRLPVRLMAGLTLWFVCVEVVNESWYRWNERHAVPNMEWSVRWPETRAGFRRIQLSPAVVDALQCDAWHASSWVEPDLSRWAGYYLRWSPGMAGARLETRVHNPEICLPAAGMKLKSDLGTRTMKINGVRLPVHAYVFDSDAGEIHVFFAVCEDNDHGEGSELESEIWGRSRRMEVVWRGERRLGYRVIEVAIEGFAGGPEEAREAFRQVIENTILPVKNG